MVVPALTGPLKRKSIQRGATHVAEYHSPVGLIREAEQADTSAMFGNQTMFPMFGGLDGTQRERSQRLDRTITKVHAGCRSPSAERRRLFARTQCMQRGVGVV
jgi:hypothetical protein